MDPSVAIRISRLSKRFGQTVAVDALSLEIHRGEVFGLLGPNGAGKTTTVSMCVGLLTPDAGTVELDGGHPTDPAVRARIGVAPQSLSIYDELSGEENLSFFATLYGLSGARRRERVAWSLQFVGLYDRRAGKARTYSGGMKRRLNLAAALVHDPELLICDEPTVGVDPQSRYAILERIGELRRLGRTIIYTTHYMEEVERICDRVGIIDRGRLLALDSVDGLISTHGGDNVVIAETPRGEVRITAKDPLAELHKLSRDGGLGRFRVERADLEQVFLKLTGRTLRE